VVAQEVLRVIKKPDVHPALRALNPRGHWQATKEIMLLLTRFRQLTWELTKRELAERYAGQMAGWVWAVAHPIVLMSVYVFIVTFVFRVRIGGTAALPLDYATYLLTGLIPWIAMQEAIARGTVSITGNARLVKQVVFPVEILPVKVVLSTLPAQIVSHVALVGYLAVTGQPIPSTIALVPVLIGLQTVLMIGLCYALAVAQVFVRDIKDLVIVFTMIGAYLAPVFYLPEMVPELFRPFLYLNPFSFVIWSYQDAGYFGRFEHPYAVPVFAAMSATAFYLGYRVFRFGKVFFGDAL
jgi:lipopolysaccharide transport system permease protein